MTDYDKFKEIYDEIEELIEKRVTSSNKDFITWHTKADRFLRKKYGDGPEFKDFAETPFSLLLFIDDTEEDYIEACKEGLETTKAKFKVYLEEMEEEREVINEESPKTTRNERKYEKVFIVHGHDGELKEAVARLIEKQGIEAVILSEQVNMGATIIEKFENNSEVEAAICLFTAV